MKKSIHLFLLALSILINGWVYAATPEPSKNQSNNVVTALPVLHSLSEEILKGTGVDIIYLPPKRFPVSRVPYWLQHKSQKRIKQLGAIDAFVTLESIWPDYAMFAHLRKANVRVVMVDAVKELQPNGAQVRLNKDDLQHQTYLWLSPDNLLVMSQIIAREFGRLWPEYAAMIHTNQQQLQQQIRSYALALEEILLASEIETVCIHNNALMPLAQATYLPIEKGEDCTGNRLLIEDWSQKSELGAEVMQKIWQVDTASKPLKTSIRVWLAQNLERLKALH